MNNAQIPVTIITGFLGAGKTTLLNNLIQKYSNKKFAIIENEIGEIGIDGALIINENDNIFELSNGCICCSLNNDFINTLNQLTESDYQFNHLLIETTGIADPDTILQAFLSSPLIQARFVIDSVIALADAINFEDMLEEQSEVRKQISIADIVLLNKVDSVRDEYAEELLQSLQNMNPMAVIHKVSFSNIENIDILDTYAYSEKSIEASTMSFQNLVFMKTSSATDSLIHKHHQHTIYTEGFIIPGAFDYEKFKLWIQTFIFFNKKNVYRIKGILCFENEDSKYVFHSIRDNYLMEEAENIIDDSLYSKLIFIGKKIDRDTIEDNLYQLLANTSV